MDDGGNEKADLMLPKDDAIRKAIEEGFGADKELVITILKVSAPNSFVNEETQTWMLPRSIVPEVVPNLAFSLPFSRLYPSLQCASILLGCQDGTLWA
jgi:hypothetical protein